MTQAQPEPRPLLTPYRNAAGGWSVDLPPLSSPSVAATGGTLVFSAEIPLSTVTAFVESFTEGVQS